MLNIECIIFTVAMATYILIPFHEISWKLDRSAINKNLKINANEEKIEVIGFKFHSKDFSCMKM